jgi:hypothetical protein
MIIIVGRRFRSMLGYHGSCLCHLQQALLGGHGCICNLKTVRGSPFFRTAFRTGAEEGASSHGPVALLSSCDPAWVLIVQR